MTIPSVAIRYGAAALVAALVWFIWGPSNGLYQVSGGGPSAWRINTTTGDISWCVPVSSQEAPKCSPFTGRHYKPASP